MTAIIKIEETLIQNNDIKAIMKTEALRRGAELLKKGELVAFPTETVYGLGADAGSIEAVKKIFEAKGRPQDNPLIVHISDLKQLEEITADPLSEKARKLIDNFWPGPLTIIFNKSDRIPDRTTAGLKTAAVRMPSHPAARALIEKSGRPLAAPSANLSGSPSTTTAFHVYQDLKGKIPLIIDGGSCEVGLESTVIDIRNNPPLILRPGGISREKLVKVLGEVREAKREVGTKEKPMSPGMKYRHYAPHTPLYIIKAEEIINFNEAYPGRFKRPVFLLTDETFSRIDYLPENIAVEKIGMSRKPELIARKLFALLRRLDSEDYDVIIVEALPEKGLGRAVMNRLYKASEDN